MPKITVTFIQKLLLTILLVIVKSYFLKSAVFQTRLFDPSQMIPTRMKKFFLSVHCNQQHFLKIQGHTPFWICYVRVVSKWICDIIRYAHRYFAVDKIKLMNLWSKICLRNKEKYSWHNMILLFELCLSTRFSNTTLEMFFSHLMVVRAGRRSRLSSESLNSVMRIRMKGLSITEFKENYSNDCINYWYSSRSRRLNQQKKKKYKDRKATKRHRPSFKISGLESHYNNQWIEWRRRLTFCI